MINQDISNKIKILINQFNAQNFELVISKAKPLIKKNPEYAILYNLIGSSYQNLGNYSEAEKNFKNGLKLDPYNIALMNNLAMSYKNLLKYKEAQELYLQIITKNEKYINAYVNFGNLKRDLNQFEEAIELYEKALKINSENHIVHYSLALAHQGLGNFKKSILYSNKTLKLNPNFTRADHLISQSTKYDNKNEHYIKLKEKINDSKFNNEEKVDLYFALAKAEEDIGNVKDACEYLLKGNKLKKELIQYNISKEINLINDLKQKFSKYKITKTKEVDKTNIIFILGLPRSGTSLVEQIISSHSQVFGCGELPILSNIIKNNFIKEEKLISNDFDEIINNPLKSNTLRNNYFNFIKNFKFSEKYVIDKAPLNFRWIGFIKNLFPNSKVIHCTREKKNNCLSMYKNLFEGGLNFTYDQKDLVSYYKSYDDLMKFWKSKYKDYIFDIKYEDLINNNTEETKKIIKFCDLEWEESCLSFHKNKNPIKTMSTAQARKPIYKTSLNAFDKFKNFLNILDNEL